MAIIMTDQEKQQQSCYPALKTNFLQFGEMPPLPHLVLAAEKPPSHPGPSAAHDEPGLQFGDTPPLELPTAPSAPPKLPLVLPKPSSPVLPPSDNSSDQKPPSSFEDMCPQFQEWVMEMKLKFDSAREYPKLALEFELLELMYPDWFVKAPEPTRKETTREEPTRKESTRKERKKLKQRANRTKGRREKAEREKAEREKAEREKAEREKAEKENAEKEGSEKENAEKESSEKENSEKEKVEEENPEKEKAESEKAEGEDRTHPSSESPSLVAAPEQPEPSENPPPAAAPEQLEPSENSPPAAAPEQLEPSENSPPAAAPEQPEPSTDSPPAVAPALARKQRRKLRQRANRALGAREKKAEREGRASPSGSPPPTQPAYIPPPPPATEKDVDPDVHPWQGALDAYNERCVRAGADRLPPVILPEVRPFLIDTFPPPHKAVGKFPMTYLVPKNIRYMVIRYLRPPGAPYTVPALFGPDPSGPSALFDVPTGKFVMPYPWISVGAGEFVNPGFGEPGQYWPSFHDWNRLYNHSLRRDHAASWPLQEDVSDNEKAVDETDEVAQEAPMEENEDDEKSVDGADEAIQKAQPRFATGDSLPGLPLIKEENGEA